MNVFESLETLCADAVERAFALAFPSALEPVQIARKLVAAFERGAPAGRGGRRFTVKLNERDFARFVGDRDYLEAQWSAMLRRLAERSRVPQRAPEVVMTSDPQVAFGTVAVAAEALPEPLRMVLCVRKGMPPGARLPLAGTRSIGREPGCDLTLVDPRLSRRHLEIDAAGETARFRDLHSANGTFLNGERRSEGVLQCGDVLQLGDTELVVEPDESEPQA